MASPTAATIEAIAVAEDWHAQTQELVVMRKMIVAVTQKLSDETIVAFTSAFTALGLTPMKERLGNRLENVNVTKDFFTIPERTRFFNALLPDHHIGYVKSTADTTIYGL